MSLNFLKFKHPFTCIVAGGTSSGKTVWTRKFLENWKYLIDIKVKRPKILWCYGIEQHLHNQVLKNVDLQYYRGIPNLDTIKNLNPDIIVLDDLMNDLKNDEKVKNLFTRDSHHLNISVIFITQNIFSNDKSMRTISLNSHYIVAMKSPRNKQQLSILCNQIWPGMAKKFTKILNKATEKKFSYLIFDLHPTLSDEKFRLRNQIFKDELPKELRFKFESSPVFYPIDEKNE